jgi:Asp-tRNA(Asn)/Glu-tRNA(Gln) amidotransferase A subunit family amidase
MKMYPFATIRELKAALETKKISCNELLDYCIGRFQQYDHTIGAALELFDKESIVNQSCSHGFLGGIPGILKDTIVQKNLHLSCG